ncbi:hypothetical protein [Rhodopirellula sp. P2]|uniref:hypothetical protein n=1 Tax=Rhodopirellula sp. P2 TaxID=2127060 RepID=UPI002368B2EB|nr:hypothetical protein [Rhodopirellula sp. P2]WDQ16152.1 hypothetical protein PSR62_21350 [Rhodopirellula sp. P2]
MLCGGRLALRVVGTSRIQRQGNANAKVGSESQEINRQPFALHGNIIKARIETEVESPIVDCGVRVEQQQAVMVLCQVRNRVIDLPFEVAIGIANVACESCPFTETRRARPRWGKWMADVPNSGGS